MILLFRIFAIMLALIISAQAQGTFPGLVPPNQVVAGPNGGGVSAGPAPRALVLPDLPITLSGNTTTVATVTGALTNGHCVSIGSNGNIIDAGSACSGVGGGGTVNSATIGQYAIYTGATAVSGVTLSGGVSCNTSGVCTLANPGASTLGGIESLAAVTSKWINTISTSGVPSATQPAFTDISGTIGTGQIASNELTNALLAQMPADTVKCNNTGSTANAADCTSITIANLNFVTAASNGINNQTAVLGDKTTFWTNVGPAIVHRMNRLMVGGDSTAGSGSPPSPADWLESLVACTTQCGQISSLSTVGIGAFVGGSRATDALAVFSVPSGGSAGAYLFGYNDDTTSGASQAIALGSNSVGLAKTGSKGITLGAQQDINCAATAFVADPGHVDNPSGATCIGNLITAGAFTFATTNSSVGLVVAPGASKKFGKGIIVQFNALDTAQGSGGDGVAMEMYPGQTLRWYNGTTGFMEIGTNNAGTPGFIFTNAPTVNGSSTVSCPSGITAATVVVVDGLVTHC